MAVKKTGKILAFIFGLALIAGFASAEKAGKSKDSVKVIRIGTTAPGHLKWVLSQKKGWWDKEFAKDGIKIEYYPFTGGGQEAVTALATGSLDFTYTGTDPALRTAEAGVDVNLIGLSSFGKSGGSSIAVRADSPIKTLADLKGKKVAYLTGTMRHATIAKALKLAGLSLKDIDGYNLAWEASGPALVRGDIDAVVEGVSTFTPLIESGQIRILLDGTTHPEWSNPSAISVRGDFLRKHPDLVKRLLSVDYAIAKWADAHFDEAIAIQAEATGKKEAALRKENPDKVFNLDPIISKEALDAFKGEEQFLIEAGLANGAIDYKKWVSDDIINKVAKDPLYVLP